MNAFFQIYAKVICENSFKVPFYLLVIIELQPKNNPFDAREIADFSKAFVIFLSWIIKALGLRSFFILSTVSLNMALEIIVSAWRFDVLSVSSL